MFESYYEVFRVLGNHRGTNYLESTGESFFTKDEAIEWIKSRNLTKDVQMMKYTILETYRIYN